MLRQLHSLPGLAATLLVIVLATSGAVLSLQPALEQMQTVSADAGVNAAELAANVQAQIDGVERIVRKASGTIIAYSFGDTGPTADIVDPTTGASLGAYTQSAFSTWVTNLHRSLFLGDNGRIATGIGAGAMLLLSISGIVLVARRMGGWGKFFAPVKGGLSQKLHLDLARFSLGGLLIISVTGIYLTAATFGVIPAGDGMGPAFPSNVDGGAPAAVSDLSALQAIDITQLRELTFPWADDPTDVFTVVTAEGSGFVDQATGTMLAFEANGLSQQIYEYIFMLHTGEGAWWLGLMLGLCALSVPVMAVTGVAMWWRRQRALPKIAKNVSMQKADAVILVGSEGNTSWAFAKSLHDGLTAEGRRVHTAPMNALNACHLNARHLFILTATYGDGGPPASASQFLSRLEALNETARPEIAVLGFGDLQFPRFCAYADQVSAAVEAKGWPLLMAQAEIDRQSVQTFEAWGRDLGEKLGHDLALKPKLATPRTHRLTLVERTDYGEDVQAPTAVLRFALPKRGWFMRGPRYEAGNLLGIVPVEDAAPRYYSLASSHRDGFVEICVRRHPGGLCSGLLHELQPGDEIAAFLKPNPAFHPARNRKPVVLIGAGTGIGPLAGLVRNNRRAKPMHLYFGGRDPASDFLYERELGDWLDNGRLARLETAFSRTGKRTYVQDRLTANSAELTELVRAGAQIMVCGGREMSAGVEAALAAILEPLGLDPQTLKREGRYVADVY